MGYSWLSKIYLISVDFKDTTTKLLNISLEKRELVGLENLLIFEDIFSVDFEDIRKKFGTYV